MKERSMILRQWQRQDAAGILIAYAQKEEVNELNGDLTMASLFSDFPFEMNGSVVICDEDKVVSTNRQELDCPLCRRSQKSV
ncbi:MAG: hypothetical protein ACLVHS_17165 [Blautia wexlerae]